MRRHPDRPTFTLALTAAALLLVLSAGAATPTVAGTRECGPWCAEMIQQDGGVRLTPITAMYEIDVFGGIAMGSLVQEFRNDTDRDVAALYRSRNPAGMKIASVTLEVNGEITKVSQKELAPANKRSDNRAAKGSRAAAPGKSRTQPSPSKPKPATVQVEAGDVVTVRTTFQTRLPLAKGLMKLTVPAVHPASRSREALVDLGIVSVDVRVHHEEPLAQANSSTHEIYTDYEGDHTRIQLADGLAGREFELEFAVGPDDDASLVGYVGREHDGTREVLAVLTPPSRPREGAARQKEMVFVLDTSGSMAKGKLDQARAALIATLQKLNGEDRFNIVEFDASFSMFSEQPVKVADAGVKSAGQWLNSQRPGGGTQLLPALLAAFEQEQDVDRHSMIVILTDGNVQDPREVEQLLQRKLGHARLFILGIGEDVNPDTIGRFAEYGRGTAVLSREVGQLEGVLAALFESISDPLAWDLEINWGGADVELIHPTKIPDLYAGRSVTILGRVRGPAPSRIEVQGTTTEGQRVFTTIVPDTEIDQLEHLVPATRGTRKR